MTQKTDNTEYVSPHPHEIHKSQRSGWLRAAVLGVNDGIVSTASLMLGVSTASASQTAVITAGIAGLAAGAFSMAIGEYVSVSSQRDSELADIAIEERSIAANPEEELQELTQIYEARGLEHELALTVAQRLHDNDAVAAHARDELGFDDTLRARPWQASMTSAVAFSVGAIVPIFATILSSGKAIPWAIVVSSLIALAISGAVGAHIGGGHKVRAAARVLVGSGLAMAATALLGHIIGSAL